MAKAIGWANMGSASVAPTISVAKRNVNLNLIPLRKNQGSKRRSFAHY